MNPLDSLIFFKTTILISSYELHPRDLFSFSFYVKNTWIPFHLLKVGLGLTPTFSVELSRTICGQRSLTSPSPCYLENTNMVLEGQENPAPVPSVHFPHSNLLTGQPPGSCFFILLVRVCYEFEVIVLYAHAERKGSPCALLGVQSFRVY